MARTSRDSLITRAQALRRWEKWRTRKTATEIALMSEQMRSRTRTASAGLSVVGAASIRDKWLATYPEARKYLDAVTERQRNTPAPSRRHSWRK